MAETTPEARERRRVIREAIEEFFGVLHGDAALLIHVPKAQEDLAYHIALRLATEHRTQLNPLARAICEAGFTPLLEYTGEEWRASVKGATYSVTGYLTAEEALGALAEILPSAD